MDYNYVHYIQFIYRELHLLYTKRIPPVPFLISSYPPPKIKSNIKIKTNFGGTIAFPPTSKLCLNPKSALLYKE
jgi:hypothetical protein